MTNYSQEQPRRRSHPSQPNNTQRLCGFTANRRSRIGNIIKPFSDRQSSLISGPSLQLALMEYAKLLKGAKEFHRHYDREQPLYSDAVRIAGSASSLSELAQVADEVFEIGLIKWGGLARNGPIALRSRLKDNLKDVLATRPEVIGLRIPDRPPSLPGLTG